MRPLVALTLAATLVACGRSDLTAVGDDPTFDAGTGTTEGADTSADASPGVDATASTKPCVWTGFSTKATYPTGVAPGPIAVADFDLDGRLDLAIANWAGGKGSPDGSVSVYLANGAGTFAAQVMYPTEIQPGGFGAGDVNGDGRPDLVVVNNLSALNVLLGASDGRFKPIAVAKTVSSATALALGDFDGDGRLDVAVASDTGSIAVAFGKGDGTFGASVSTPTGHMPKAMKVADVDGDGHADLVVTNVEFPASRGLPVALGPGSVNVLRNEGAGTFAPQVVYPVGNGTTDVAVGDLDGDRHPDLVVANTVSGSLAVLFNEGDGRFRATPKNYALGPQPTGVTASTAVALADFNGDGKLDVVVTSEAPNGANLEIFLNAGQGRLTGTLDVAVLDAVSALATGDLDGDGRLDLAVTSGRGTVSILLDECR
jgi:FG-GAP-like repeat/FG-GAP repeat